MSSIFVGRTRARSQAIQILFQAEVQGIDVFDLIDSGSYALDDGPLEKYAEQLAGRVARPADEHPDATLGQIAALAAEDGGAQEDDAQQGGAEEGHAADADAQDECAADADAPAECPAGADVTDSGDNTEQPNAGE